MVFVGMSGTIFKNAFYTFRLKSTEETRGIELQGRGFYIY